MKCHQCLKAVLIPMICKCDQVFCIKHRTPEKHSCNFDFLAAARATIAKENPVVIASKVDKI